MKSGSIRSLLVLSAFTDLVLVLTGNNDMCVSPQDVIDFYQETGSTDRSLRIYVGIPHVRMEKQG